MIVLTLLDPDDSAPLRQWRFAHDAKIRVGRAPDNQIILSDRRVSRHHLEFQRLDAAAPVWQVLNHSTNGTFLGGDRVLQQRLSEDCLLQLARGGPRLRFQILLPTRPEVRLPQLFQRSQPTLCTHPGNAPQHLFCIHCGQPIRVEKTIRQYQVLRVLGRGGMGTTYLVWNPAAIAPSAPKGTLQVLKEMNADMARIPKAQELFEREAGILKALAHPGIPRFHDFFVEAGKKYLVMELVHGQNLEQVVQQGPIAPPQAIEWMLQTCEVLDYLHNHPVPIIHRDIKPSNLLVQALNKRIVVLDFGAVKAAGVHSGTRIGAEGYSAPEQTRGRPVPQSDLYAIGSTLFFLVTGEHPQGYHQRLAEGYRLQAKHPAIAPRLRQTIERATALRPSDRYRTARDLSQALSNCL